MHDMRADATGQRHGLLAAAGVALRHPVAASPCRSLAGLNLAPRIPWVPTRLSPDFTAHALDQTRR